MSLPLPPTLAARALLTACGAIFCTSGLVGFNVLVPGLGERFGGETASGAERMAYGASLSMLASLVLCPVNFLTARAIGAGTLSAPRACLYASMAGVVGLGGAGLGVLLEQYWLSLLSFGLGQGVSLGASYIALLAVTRAWFAKLGRPGLGFGLLGAAMGVAAAVFAAAAELLLRSFGIGETLVILSVGGEAPRTLLRSGRFWLFALGLLLALLPGWGFKLLVSSLLSARFDTDLETGTKVTTLSLLLYAGSRLAAGWLTDCVPATAMYSATLGIQQVLVGLLASMASVGVPEASLEAFSGLQVCITMCFGFLKTLYPLVVGWIWPNDMIAIGLVAPCFGLAGAIGPAVYLVSLASRGGEEAALLVLTALQLLAVVFVSAAMASRLWIRSGSGSHSPPRATAPEAPKEPEKEGVAGECTAVAIKVWSV
ncbi:hypothetical protein EMIHUDRAFT_98433 [Emiliania huxleyi CCMP1516]|uniref:Major facilitator superfamily (MFS) profile domain-containing protein n=2 Tax=Emiliania huxleyi TaxID=2903 RepID=A0A0D3KI25_EMIH1|nr:hypothetical protein EMIHUDRAFT_98433 [Emiliania huxleyi CCMP1516]EOD35410.1 hypothetical protein EMIHUDRAFT_98433 [Emiliania huxleyi CCMP1516]|eukprot:XP_005787839.1 hypothetical protein EMIHUDRAFT_98433 [Emiliania huxleyi CCMP1516]